MNISLGVCVWECQQLPLRERGGGTQSLECENDKEPSFLIFYRPIKFTSTYKIKKNSDFSKVSVLQ
jgi:hypothetical protein